MIQTKAKPSFLAYVHGEDPNPCCTSVHSDPALHFPTVFGSSNIIRNNEGPVQADQGIRCKRVFAFFFSELCFSYQPLKR